jgi:2-keto-4-pentenoate hydratase/2-oxohepta-3-ene-1,7-dioic acid hydratase in catechol pathway
VRLGTFFLASDPRPRAALFTDDGRALDLAAAAVHDTGLALLRRAPSDHAWLTPQGQDEIRALVARVPIDSSHWHRVDEVHLGVPIPRPGKIIAAGRNYRDHVREGEKIWAARGKQVTVPTFPTGFAKFPTSLCATGQAITIPVGVEAVDYEIELAVVIGRPALRVGIDDALNYVAGYTICNDVGARRIQMAEMEQQIGIVLAKNLPSFAPLGPWLITADEILDPQQLALHLTVNGEIRQDAHTRDMIFSVAALISYWSQVGLEPGDILTTGTPAGVAIGRAEPDRYYLRDGDVVAATIERIGTLQNPVRAEST